VTKRAAKEYLAAPVGDQINYCKALGIFLEDDSDNSIKLRRMFSLDEQYGQPVWALRASRILRLMIGREGPQWTVLRFTRRSDRRVYSFEGHA